MPDHASAALDSRATILRNFSRFRALADQASNEMQRGHLHEAAAIAEVAASYAATNHCGIFSSPRLESMLEGIGERLPPTENKYGTRRGYCSSPTKILHVATVVLPIGGHSRMLWRWIEEDTGRRHSVALTRQVGNPIPEPLRAAVSRSSGTIYRINEAPGSLLRWASRLRATGADADMVILHVHPHDVIPSIAFSNRQPRPPVILVNHADHLFWLGSRSSDVVVSLREAGMRLSYARRGVKSQRGALLPIPLKLIRRNMHRAEAKKRLGLADFDIVLLCVARSLKFGSKDGISYAHAHVPVLMRHPEAALVVVGAGGGKEWSDASDQVNGRILTVPETEDTELYYQAADVYVDSYPFVSNTSLLEAGGCGLPLVSRYHAVPGSEIFDAGAPGLTSCLVRAADLNEYTNLLSRIISDEAFRLCLGEETSASIRSMHVGAGWITALDQVYQLCREVPDVETSYISSEEQPSTGDLDVLTLETYGGQRSFEDVIRASLRIMPPSLRFRQWCRLREARPDEDNQPRWMQVRHLLPEWLLCRTRHLWRPLYKSCLRPGQFGKLRAARQQVAGVGRPKDPPPAVTCQSAVRRVAARSAGTLAE